MADEPLPLLPHEERLPPRTDLWIAAGFLVLQRRDPGRWRWRMPTYADQGGQIYTAPGLVPSFYGVVIGLLSLWLAGARIARRRARARQRPSTRDGQRQQQRALRARSRARRALHRRADRPDAVLARGGDLRDGLRRRLRVAARARAEGARAAACRSRSSIGRSHRHCWSRSCSSASSSSVCPETLPMLDSLGAVRRRARASPERLGRPQRLLGDAARHRHRRAAGADRHDGRRADDDAHLHHAARAGDPRARLHLCRRDLRRQPQRHPAQHPGHAGLGLLDARRLPARPPGPRRPRHGHLDLAAPGSARCSASSASPR